MNTINYDIVILGGGCAGMQLMHQLVNHPKYLQQSILIIDSNKTYLQSKSWCFWHTANQHTYQSIIDKTWDSIAIGVSGGRLQHKIHPYKYSYIKSEHFFDFHFKEISNNAKTTYLNEVVIKTEKVQDGFIIKTNEAEYKAGILYTSYWDNNEIVNEHKILLQQQFFGWEIEADQPVFKDDAATLMDFNINQTGGVNFAYVLPYNSTNALVEITGFSEEAYSIDYFEEVLNNYIKENWNTRFKIIKTEHASIPMTNFPFKRHNKIGAISIGTAAGMVKPTTGYAFNRINRDSIALANAYFDGESPSAFTRNRFQFYDRLLLQLIKSAPQKALHILMQLFKKTNYQLILQFLDEDTSIIQEAQIFSKLPKKDFIQQIFY